MNIVQLQEQLKNFSQDQLVREMQMPSGNTPQFLVLGEIMRRQKMQQDFASRQGQGVSQTTVAEDAIASAGVPQGGIADMARALAPKTNMTENTGVQAMAAGGPVKKMAAGDRIVRGGKILIEQEDGTYRDENGRVVRTALEDIAAIPSDLATAMDIRSGEQERTWAQRNIGDPLRNLFQPVGEAGRAIGQPVGEALRSVGQPVGEALRGVGEPVGEALRSTLGPAPTPALDRRAQFEPTTESDPLAFSRAMMRQNLPFTEETGIVDPEAAVAAGVAPRAPARQAQFEPPASLAVQPEAPSSDTEIPLDPRLQAAIDEIPAQLREQGITDGTIDMEAEARKSAEEAAAARDAAGITRSRETPFAPEQAQPDTDTTVSTSSSSGGAGAGGVAGLGGMSSFEQELMDALGRREKAAEQDKWLALAQVGLNLMSSTQPTLMGALGEAGLKGVEAARTARDQYDKDRLELLGAVEQSRQARAAAAAKAARGAASGGVGSLGISAGAARLLTQINSDIERLTNVVNDPYLRGAIAAGEATPEEEISYAQAQQKLQETIAIRESLLYGGAAVPQEDELSADLSD